MLSPPARKQWLRSAAIRLVAYSVIAYFTAGLFFYLNQGNLLFPAPKVYDTTTPISSGLHYEDLQIPVNARDHLHAWWIPAALPSAKTIINFHGNGYVLEDMVKEEVVSLHELGANLMLIDYRGYGSSTPVTPNESTIEDDSRAALTYVLRERNVPKGRVFVLGRSIGSGPALQLALENTGLGGLILESPFTSVDEVAAASWYFRIYPARLMLHTHFDNLSKIGSVRVPVLLVSGTVDTLTPAWMAEKLFARAHQPKQLCLVAAAGHNNLLDVGGMPLTRVLHKFVDSH